jgi:hypothetical protein
MSRVKDLFEAYEEGKQVAQEGWMCMNPYEEGSYMKEYWDRGYRDVLIQSTTRRSAKMDSRNLKE